MNSRFFTKEKGYKSCDNSTIIDINRIKYCPLRLDEEINHIITLLTGARTKRQQSLLIEVSLNTIFGMLLLTSLYFFIRGSIDTAYNSNVSRDLQDKMDKLQSANTRSWIFANNSLCSNNYSTVNPRTCPPDSIVTLEFCKNLLTNFCESLNELFLKEQEIPSLWESMLSMLCGLGITIILSSIYKFHFDEGDTLLNKFSQPLEYSHAYIPKEHDEYIKKLAKYLMINIDNNFSVRSHIEQFKERRDEILTRRKERLTFLKGSVDKNSHAYYFFKVDGDRMLTYKILSYIDRFFPYSKRFANENDEEEEVNLLNL